MPVVPHDLPAHCRPRAPEPPHDRLVRAARAICDHLAGDQFGQPVDDQRGVNASTACAGFPRGPQRGEDPNSFRWAVRRMVECGLLRVVERTEDPAEPDPEAILVLPAPDRPPEILLLSTPLLWPLWREGGILVPGVGPADGRPCPHWDEVSRTRTFASQVLRVYQGHPAPLQTGVLTAFEQAGWPDSIQPPIRPDQIGDTVRGLSRALTGQPSIRFGRDGTGRRVTWARA